MADFTTNLGPVSVSHGADSTTINTTSGPVRGSATITKDGISGKLEGRAGTNYGSLAVSRDSTTTMDVVGIAVEGGNHRSTRSGPRQGWPARRIQRPDRYLQSGANGTYHDGDGFLEDTAWVGADDGFLVMDLDALGRRGHADGDITQAKELSISEWANWDATDLHALSTFDKWTSRGGDQDGKIDPGDTIWNDLRVWQDKNQNGIVDADEIKTLNSLGITEIRCELDNGKNFSDTSDDKIVFGSAVTGLASYARNGNVVRGGIGDVTLGFDANGYRRVEDASGFRIEFEGGRVIKYRELTGSGTSSVNLNTEGVEGAVGDNRANTLDARGNRPDSVLFAEGGTDTLHGGDGDDYIEGGWGYDQIEIGGWGDKHVVAGENADQIYVSSDRGNHVILGGRGQDKVHMTGSRSDYVVEHVQIDGATVNYYQIIDKDYHVVHIMDVEAIVYNGGTDTQ